MSIELTDQQADGWLARLEDPATIGAERRLRDMYDPKAMCCLGHLADILDPEGWVKGEASWFWPARLSARNAVDLPHVTYRGLPLDQGRMASINDSQHRFPIPEIREWVNKARAQP